MVCPYCGNRIKMHRAYFSTLERHEIDTFCSWCGRLITLTKDDADRERELQKLSVHERRRAQGLCPKCGVYKALDGYQRCARCIGHKEEAKEQPKVSLDVKFGIDKKTYNYRVSYGLCIICGEPAKHSAKICEKCKERIRRDERQG